MKGKLVLQDLVFLDEVYKRIRDGVETKEDRAFARELLQRIRGYEEQTGRDYSYLVALAKKGEFCPVLGRRLGG